MASTITLRKFKVVNFHKFCKKIIFHQRAWPSKVGVGLKLECFSNIDASGCLFRTETVDPSLILKKCFILYTMFENAKNGIFNIINIGAVALQPCLFLLDRKVKDNDFILKIRNGSFNICLHFSIGCKNTRAFPETSSFSFSKSG